MGAVLGILCLVWVPCWVFRDALGRAEPIVGGTFYTLVFVASALFMLAGAQVVAARSFSLRRPVVALAVLLFAMYGRKFIASLEGIPWLATVTHALILVVPATAGVVLLALSRKDWSALNEEPAPT
ncbi:MAG: hypothetical protein JNK04_12800 [Myxococcales bacterium]|nr:hypothetical protein [Myxococcales bacterium]